MAAQTLSQGIAYARLLAADVDPTNPGGLTDAEYTDIGNDYYQRWMQQFDDEVTQAGVVYATGSGTGWQQITLSTGSLTFARPMFAHIATTAGLLSTAPTLLERREFYDVVRDQRTITTNAQPTSYALVPSASQGTISTYRVFWHPVPDAVYYVQFWGKLYPLDLSAGTDVPFVGDAESRYIWRMVAAEVAGIIGRGPEVIQRILAPIPNSIQVEMGLAAADNRPRPRPGVEGF